MRYSKPKPAIIQFSNKPITSLRGPRSRAVVQVGQKFGYWILLSGAALGLLSSTHFLPLYDYYQWLFQGHLVAGLLFGRSASSEALNSLYGLSPVPVPNLAAPLGIGFLNIWLPIEVAGQLFVVLGVLAFVYSFAYLMRSIQQQPTVLEFAGFIWAFGFFLYKGYLSYLFALPLLFLIVGKLHRDIVVSPKGITRPALFTLTALGAALYLSHLMAWSIAFLATLVYAVLMLRRGQRQQAVWLALTLLPALVMLAWYTIAKHGGSGISFYNSLSDKGLSLVEPLLLFLRLDPFPAAFPLFWANLLLGLLLVGVVFANLNWPALKQKQFSRPVLVLGGLLAAAAVFIPIANINDLIKPDERFTLPALLITLVALPYKKFSLRRGLLLGAIVLVVLGLHLVEYVAVGQAMRRIDVATETSIPANEPVLSMAIAVKGGCVPGAGPSIGVPTLKWFGVDRNLEVGQLRVNFDQTSFVYSKFDQKTHPGLTVLDSVPAQFLAQVLPSSSTYRYIEIFACQADLQTAKQNLAPQYSAINEGEGFAIFRKQT